MKRENGSGASGRRFIGKAPECMEGWLDGIPQDAEKLGPQPGRELSVRVEVVRLPLLRSRRDLVVQLQDAPSELIGQVRQAAQIVQQSRSVHDCAPAIMPQPYTGAPWYVKTDSEKGGVAVRGRIC